MNQKNFTFFKALKLLFTRLLNRRIHFSNEYIGKILLMDDGKKFQVIRDLKVDVKQSQKKSAAVFKVRFKFSGLPLYVNKRLSMFPTPFLIAKLNFIQKIWCVSEDGCFQGIYQWASEECAESYPQSFIFKMMVKRSAENTLSYEIIPNQHLLEFVQNSLIKNV